VGFFRGLFAPFRGLTFVARNRLWRYLLVPILLNIALGIGAFWSMAIYWRQEVAPSLSAHPIWAWIGFIGATILTGVAIFVVLNPLLNAIFNDRLSEKVEMKVRGNVPKTPFLASSGRALAHGLLKLALYGVAILVGFVLSIPSVGLGALVGVAMGGVFLAYDGFDYPLSRRGASFGAKWAYLALHPGLTLGYGLGATALYLVPLAFVVAPPLAAVGATLVFLEDETQKEKRADKKAQKLAEKLAQKNVAPAASPAAASPTTAEKGNVAT
jgi:CysZ protein